MENIDLMSACASYAANPESSTALDNVPDSNLAQMETLKRLISRYERKPDDIQIGILGYPEVLTVRFGTLWIAIEKDGYAHS